MEQDFYLFRQLAFVRAQTLKAVEGISEETADLVPEGFRNNIRWNLGHIYVVLERFAFHYIGLPQQLPSGFKERYEFGTSPVDSTVTGPIPTLPELAVLLSEQQDRIREALAGRLNEKLEQPYTTSTGITLETPHQFLGFSLYHEGMHFSVIKLYKRLLSE